MNDYFSAQELILVRLIQQLPEFRLVRGARDLASVRARPGASPSAYVLYNGQEALVGAGREQAVAQQWLVVVVVKNLRDSVGGQGERQEVGPLLIQVCQALLGWKPGEEHGALAMANAPGPTFHEGFGFYPLMFTTRVIVQGI